MTTRPEPAQDAALPDAALPDAALSDAALSDAALSDAALSDAALSDAALSDAALSDAALSDAALSDAALSDAALSYDDVRAAAARIDGEVRRVTVAEADRSLPGRVWFALEFLQHTGSFKARGALNFVQTHRAAGTMPEAGITIASGGNAGLACAWAARRHGVPATVFLPETAPAVKVARLRSYGAEVRQVGMEYADALAACQEFAASSGALASHAYDDPLIAAGAGTLLDEIRAQVPDLDTVVVATGGGGLFSGVSAAAREHGMAAVAVEPERCRALHAALEADRVVDVTVDSVAADSLGARRASEMALAAARLSGSRSVLVPDDAIVSARQELWDHYRIAVEHAAATALAGLVSPSGYRVADDERICVVLCGANTDPSDLS